MKKFLRNIVIFCIPFIIFIAPFLMVGIYSLELLNIDYAIKIQRKSDDEKLLGMAYNEQSAYLKIKNINYYSPQISTLGSSRVLQFKDEFFETSFYNGGRGVASIADWEKFIDNINAEALPDILIIGLDSWEFNPNWEGLLANSEDLSKPIKISIFERLENEMKDYRDNKWSFKEIINNNGNLGFNGIFKNSGFLKDGSYYYGNIYKNPESTLDYQFRDTYGRIEHGILRFEYSDTIEQETLDYLEHFLLLCSEKDIEIIGFIPPFAPSVYQKMKSYGNQYGYLDKIGDECQLIFNQYGYEFYDYTDISNLDCDDSFFIDGFHGSEVAYLRILLDMLNQNSVLNQYIDSNKLNQLYQNRYSNMILRKSFYE